MVEQDLKPYGGVKSRTSFWALCLTSGVKIVFMWQNNYLLRGVCQC